MIERSRCRAAILPVKLFPSVSFAPRSRTGRLCRPSSEHRPGIQRGAGFDGIGFRRGGGGGAASSDCARSQDFGRSDGVYTGGRARLRAHEASSLSGGGCTPATRGGRLFDARKNALGNGPKPSSRCLAPLRREARRRRDQDSGNCSCAQCRDSHGDGTRPARVGVLTAVTTQADPRTHTSEHRAGGEAAQHAIEARAAHDDDRQPLTILGWTHEDRAKSPSTLGAGELHVVDDRDHAFAGPSGARQGSSEHLTPVESRLRVRRPIVDRIDDRAGVGSARRDPQHGQRIEPADDVVGERRGLVTRFRDHQDEAAEANRGLQAPHVGSSFRVDAPSARHASRERGSGLTEPHDLGDCRGTARATTGTQVTCGSASRQPREKISRALKKKPISNAAVSAASEPWAALRSMSVPKRLRTVPSAASLELVAPSTSR